MEDGENVQHKDGCGCDFPERAQAPPWSVAPCPDSQTVGGEFGYDVGSCLGSWSRRRSVSVCDALSIA